MGKGREGVSIGGEPLTWSLGVSQILSDGPSELRWPKPRALDTHGGHDLKRKSLPLPPSLCIRSATRTTCMVLSTAPRTHTRTRQGLETARKWPHGRGAGAHSQTKGLGGFGLQIKADGSGGGAQLKDSEFCPQILGQHTHGSILHKGEKSTF